MRLAIPQVLYYKPLAMASEARRIQFMSAAMRHMRDAEHLALRGPDQSVDQAFHLAGFAPECARKALLRERLFDKALGHDIDDSRAWEFALALDPRAARLLSVIGAAPNVFRRWSPTCRYDKTGSANASETELLVREARRWVDATALELWTDGLAEIASL